MPDAGNSHHTARPAQRRRQPTAMKRQGLALRFALIIGDRRLTEALQVVCVQDAVTVEFPETSVRIGLSRLLSEESGGVVLDCRASYRSDGRSPRETTRTWQRVLTGRPGALHQREALLREILAARSHAPGRIVVRPNLASLRYLAAAV
ncbi:hypothetical protein [Streptomyces sp. NPDC016626]|jgi:hypothetical protein|uniref:hypothetical protein n=1 Tax=Streptomyces sp. NPDC016626 TaxID=3364968 RepID=UPI0036F6C032